MNGLKSKSLQALIQDFFVKHLAVECNAGTNTVAAYRDAMKLFLRYASDLVGRTPDQLDHKAFDVETVRNFLDWLRHERNCKARTRNHRLACLKAFARYVATVAPEHLERCRRIRQIPLAKIERPPIQYLSEEEIVQLISSVDDSTCKGKRDRALLLLIYNTGARVQEIADLDIGDICKQPIPLVRLRGKGRKQRTCPLWPRTVTAIERMLHERSTTDDSHPLFLGAKGHRLSRSGIAYILRSAQDDAHLRPTHADRITPHVIRHTTAMHLLQSQVDITTIAAWLGHSKLETTHEYVEIDLRMKQAAIACQIELPEIPNMEYPEPDLVQWLEQLIPKPSYVQSSDVLSRNSKLDRNALHITARGG